MLKNVAKFHGRSSQIEHFFLKLSRTKVISKELFVETNNHVFDSILLTILKYFEIRSSSFLFFPSEE